MVAQAVSTKAKVTDQDNGLSSSLGEESPEHSDRNPDIKVSIIIPVFNEFSRAEKLLQSLQFFRDPNVEIIIVDGGSDDGTASYCRDLEGLLVDKVLTSQTGRSWQMNAGAAVAQGEWLFFLHLDSQLPGDWLSAFLSNDISSDTLWGFFTLALSNPSIVYRCIASSINIRSRLSGAATGDQCLFVRREIFEAIGAYAEIPLMEDVELCDRLKALGKGRQMPQKLVTSSRRWETNGVINTIVFMWRLRIAYRMGVCPWTLAQRYYPNVKFSAPVSPPQ